MNAVNSQWSRAVTIIIAMVMGVVVWWPSVVAAQTMNFAGGPENTQWMLSGNVFECRFQQHLPGYGEAVFYHQAGQDVTFQLEPERNLMAASNANITITPPPWKPAERSERLGTSRVNKDGPAVVLDSERSNQFLHALREGRMPTISHQAYYDPSRYVQIQVSAVEFEGAFRDYLLCANQLLTMNLGQVARSKVFFKSSEEQLDKADIQELEKVVYYIKHDPRVTGVYLDGHTDNVGRRYDNRQISKRRVEAVERYFLQQGIDSEIITTRFHGGRYPVASNKTVKGRNENRRVTIRLEVDEDIPLPDALVFKLPEDSQAVPPLNYPTSAQR
jgi:outer membrane protein OmpA-like peptidoglycan-associated protein